MVIQTLKAQIASLTEATKEKGVPEKVMTTLKESASKLQGLLDKAREAAKESYQAKEEEEEEEAGEPMAGEEAGEEPAHDGGHIDAHKVKPGHKMTKTVTVKHDGPAPEEEEDGDEPEPKDDADEKDAAEESRKVHLEMLLQEAGIPKEICTVEKLIAMSLKEAKAEIAEKKAMIDLAKKAVEGNLEFVPAGSGAEFQESNGGETLNSLFTGCAE